MIVMTRNSLYVAWSWEREDSTDITCDGVTALLPCSDSDAGPLVTDAAVLTHMMTTIDDVTRKTILHATGLASSTPRVPMESEAR